MTIFSGVFASLIASISLLAIARTEFATNFYLGARVNHQTEWKRLGNHNSKCLKSFAKCVQADFSANKRVLFWVGDSHTEHLLPLAKEISSKHGVKYIVYTSAGLTHQLFPTLNMSRQGVPFSDYKKERDNLNFAYNRTMANLKKGDAIVISLNLPRYFSGTSDQSADILYFSDQGKKITVDDALGLWLQRLQNMGTFANNKGVKIIVLLPTPQFKDYPGISVCYEQPFRPLSINGCRIANKEKDIYAGWVTFIQRIRAEVSINSNILLYDPRSSFCGINKLCKNYTENTLFFVDGDHLRKEGALRMYPGFARFLRAEVFSR